MRNPVCQLCDRHKSAKEVCIYGRSIDSTQKDIMIIIDNISSATNQSASFGSGQGGEYLVKLLKEIGLLEFVYVTSAVKCYSPKKPVAKEMYACRKYLLQEIEEVKPKLIICLGNIASNTLFGKIIRTKDLRQRFYDYETENHKCKVACTFSHNVVFVDPNKFNTLSKDLQWIMSNFKSEEEKFDYAIVINDTIPESNIYGLDIESTGLNMYKEKIISIAIADPINKISVGLNISHPKGEIYE